MLYTYFTNIRCGIMATAEENKSFYLQKFDEFSFFCDMTVVFADAQI